MSVCDKENGMEFLSKSSNVFRMYESGNTSVTCALKFGFEIKEVHITNMLEENKTKVDTNEKEISLKFKPFEVVTLRVRL